MPGITAIVCTYRRSNFLGACLDSLTSQTAQDLSILVVGVKADTASRDLVIKRGVPFVAQAEPEGIAAARNLGIKSSTDPIVAFIDDDARARAGWAEALVGAFESADVGGVGGPVFDTRKGIQYVFDWRVDPFGISHTVREHQDWKGMLPTINGCNMAFSRSALDKIGGFDPYYRYYYDETDLCVRLAQQGFSIRFEESAIVDHDFAEGPTRNRFLYNSTRTRAYFSLKNFGQTVPVSRLFAGQVRLIRNDIRAYRLFRQRYKGLRGGATALQEACSGRIRGIVDGIGVLRQRRARSRSV